jgi:branched-chain amino acid transport system ATP-binding protein
VAGALGMTLLRLDRLRVRFGGVVALDEVSMLIEPGEIRGLIGPNGAGKTSLVNAITRVVKSAHGSIEFRGRDITALAPDRISSIGIGRTFQHVELFRDQSVLQNIRTGLNRHHTYGLAAAAIGIGKARRQEAEVDREAWKLLESFALADVANDRAGDLPFGVQKRIDMARALAARPQLLLLDEPVSGMSETEADQAVAATRALAHERGITLLVIEHNMRVMMRLAERITVLHRGRIIADGAPAAVRADPAVIDAYLGEDAADA